MKRKHLIVVSLLASSTVFGQEVVSSAGETYTGTNGVIDFTLGEVVISTVSSTSNDITQGFHQTNWNFVGLDDFDPDFEANVYPNPMETTLNVSVSEFEDVHYELIDATGRIVQASALTEEITKIDVQNYVTGSYQLRLLKSNNELIKNFNLIKN